jgi:hypothetical protein
MHTFAKKTAAFGLDVSYKGRSVTYGQGKWVAVGYGPKIFYAADPNTWVEATISFGTYDGASVVKSYSAPNMNRFYALLYATGKSALVYSADGISWSYEEEFASDTYQDLEYIPSLNRLILVGNRIAYKNLPSGTWNTTTSGPLIARSITWNGSIYVATGAFTFVLYAYGDILLNNTILADTSSCTNAIWTGTNFILLATKTGVQVPYYSTDGIAWTAGSNITLSTGLISFNKFFKKPRAADELAFALLANVKNYWSGCDYTLAPWP